MAHVTFCAQTDQQDNLGSFFNTDVLADVNTDDLLQGFDVSKAEPPVDIPPTEYAFHPGVLDIAANSNAMWIDPSVEQQSAVHFSRFPPTKLQIPEFNDWNMPDTAQPETPPPQAPLTPPPQAPMTPPPRAPCALSQYAQPPTQLMPVTPPPPPPPPPPAAPSVVRSPPESPGHASGSDRSSVPSEPSPAGSPRKSQKKKPHVKLGSERRFKKAAREINRRLACNDALNEIARVYFNVPTRKGRNDCDRAQIISTVLSYFREQYRLDPKRLATKTAATPRVDLLALLARSPSPAKEQSTSRAHARAESNAAPPSTPPQSPEMDAVVPPAPSQWSPLVRDSSAARQLFF